MLFDEIVEYPFRGVVKHTIVGKGGKEDQVVEIYNGVMDETKHADNEGRTLQTSSHVVSMPLTRDNDGNYIVPRKGDTIELDRYGEIIYLTVDNAKPSQLQGISVYCSRKKW